MLFTFKFFDLLQETNFFLKFWPYIHIYSSHLTNYFIQFKMGNRLLTFNGATGSKSYCSFYTKHTTAFRKLHNSKNHQIKEISQWAILHYERVRHDMQFHN